MSSKAARLPLRPSLHRSTQVHHILKSCSSHLAAARDSISSSVYKFTAMMNTTQSSPFIDVSAKESRDVAIPQPQLSALSIAVPEGTRAKLSPWDVTTPLLDWPAPANSMPPCEVCPMHNFRQLFKERFDSLSCSPKRRLALPAFLDE